MIHCSDYWNHYFWHWRFSGNNYSYLISFILLMCKKKKNHKVCGRGGVERVASHTYWLLSITLTSAKEGD